MTFFPNKHSYKIVSKSNIKRELIKGNLSLSCILASGPLLPSKVTTSNPIRCPPSRSSSVQNPLNSTPVLLRALQIFFIKVVFPIPKCKSFHYNGSQTHNKFTCDPYSYSKFCPPPTPNTHTHTKGKMGRYQYLGQGSRMYNIQCDSPDYIHVFVGMINNQPIPDFDIFTFQVSDNQSSVFVEMN